MTDEAGIDWNEARQACLGLAELVWTYHQALLAAGFPDVAALSLAALYQTHLLENAQEAE